MFAYLALVRARQWDLTLKTLKTDTDGPHTLQFTEPQKGETIQKAVVWQTLVMTPLKAVNFISGDYVLIREVQVRLK